MARSGWIGGDREVNFRVDLTSGFRRELSVVHWGETAGVQAWISPGWKGGERASKTVRD